MQERELGPVELHLRLLQFAVGQALHQVDGLSGAYAGAGQAVDRGRWIHVIAHDHDGAAHSLTFIMAPRGAMPPAKLRILSC